MTPSRLRLMGPDELRHHEESERLYRNLGEFFLLWSDAEKELYKALIHYSGVTDDIGRAIFSGCRARSMIDFIRNIAQNTKMNGPRKNDLDYLFAQINTINTIRDKIAHYASATNFGVAQKTLLRSVSNYRRSGKMTNEFHIGINSELVEAMCDDLRRLQYRLSLHHRKNAPTRLGEDVPRDASTWRYIPFQPRNPKNKTQASPQERQRRKRPSP